MSDKPKKRIVEQLKLDGFWDNMSPNHRRGAVVVGGIACLFLLMASITSGEDSDSRKTRDSVKRSVLTDADTRSIGIDALNAKVKTVESENDGLRKKLDRVQTGLNELKRRRGNDPDMTRQMAVLQSQVKNITDKAKTLGWEVADIKEGYYQVPSGIHEDSSEMTTEQLTQPKVQAEVKPIKIEKKISNIEDGLNEDPNYYFRTAPVRPASPAPVAGAPDLQTGAQPGGGLKIFTVESVAQSLSDHENDKNLMIPSGSIISGVILNGLDAATGRSARKDPFPVLVRIQKDAILPNNFIADVKECFATLAGYGELSSERAMLRGETFSCITKNGDVIEEEFPAYAVGEDGKAGIRGRLVSKAGSLIAKTALAGFATGVAEAFDTSPVPVIRTGDVGGSKLYQENFSSDAAQHGVSSGASAAMTRLAEYYMDMADQIFPVIEVDAGRQVDVVLTHGIKLKVRENQALTIAKKDEQK